MQEQRLSKQLRNAHKDLLEIQATRKAAEKQALREAAKLYQLHHEQLAANSQSGLQPTSESTDADPAPEYGPAADGFVFTIPEIVSYIDFTTRSFRATQANFLREIALGAECASDCD